MLQALATLLVFQTIGEVLSFALALPVPGPVLGMALLLTLLLARAIDDRAAAAHQRRTAQAPIAAVRAGRRRRDAARDAHCRRVAADHRCAARSTALAIAVTALVIRWSMQWLTPDDAQS
jgi:holin-like protein